MRLKRRWSNQLDSWLQRRTGYRRRQYLVGKGIASQEVMTPHVVTGLQNFSENTGRHLQMVQLLWRRGSFDQHWCIPGFHLHYLQ